jgi:hypothetical protein
MIPEKAIEELIERSLNKNSDQEASNSNNNLPKCSFCMSHIRNPKFTLKWSNYYYHSQCANFYANFISQNPPLQ